MHASAILKKSPEELWQHIPNGLESGFVDYLSLKGKEAANMKGRSKVSIGGKGMTLSANDETDETETN